MSVATLKTKVKHLAKDFASSGFQEYDSYLIKRSFPWLDQVVELQPGRKALRGKFACNVGWKFKFPEFETDNAVSYMTRITTVWYPHEPKEALDASYAQICNILKNYGVPFLDSVNSPEKMVALYEAALAEQPEITPLGGNPLFFFGRGGWKECFLGFCYDNLGNTEKAKHHLRKVITEHSQEPYDFVLKRKEACERKLKAFGATTES